MAIKRFVARFKDLAKRKQLKDKEGEEKAPLDVLEVLKNIQELE